MRPFVIITVTFQDGQENLFYDLEVPTDVPAGQVARDMAEVLNHYRQKEILPMNGCSLLNKRTGKALRPEETFSRAGVWQGDVLMIKK